MSRIIHEQKITTRTSVQPLQRHHVLDTMRETVLVATPSLTSSPLVVRSFFVTQVAQAEGLIERTLKGPAVDAIIGKKLIDNKVRFSHTRTHCAHDFATLWLRPFSCPWSISTNLHVQVCKSGHIYIHYDHALSGWVCHCAYITRDPSLIIVHMCMRSSRAGPEAGAVRLSAQTRVGGTEVSTACSLTEHSL